MRIRPIAPFAGSHRQYSLPNVSKFAIEFALPGVPDEPSADCEHEYFFEADGRPCAVWRMRGMSSWSVFGPHELVVHILTCVHADA
jgi:hypothetical protein